MYNRRKFLSRAVLATGAVLAGPRLLAAVENDAAPQKLTILHTNDTHSRLDPFPMDGSRNQGLGGVAARAELIEKIRQTATNLLLLDAGDIFQGTPYFNFFKGEPELKAMSSMGYDAATIGNHDFDAGIENLAEKLSKHARFNMLVCNYDFAGTPMENMYSPYQVFRRGRLRIGVTGVGIALKGLVPENLYGATIYLDPVQKVNEIAYLLKKEERCDLVVCLSHLGYRYNHNRVSDEVLAKESENIDVIIGGHTHTFLDSPVTMKNKNGNDVLINQVGWAGILLGRLDLEFSKGKLKNLPGSGSITVTKKRPE